MAGPEEFLVILLTALILPAIAILVTVFLTGAMQRMESVKYVVLMEEEPEEDDDVTPIESPAERRWAT